MTSTKKDTADKEVPEFAILATDTALFTLHDNELFVRVIRVHRPPFFVEALGLPGGLVEPQETGEEATVRHIANKARVASNKIHLEQLATFSTVDRDPRGRVVAIGYLALVPWEKLSTTERANTDDVSWISVKKIPHLAYDHDDIIKMAILRLQTKIKYTSMISKLLGDEFTLTELEDAYKVILNEDIDKRNFRKKLLKLDILTASDKYVTGKRHRPAQLYHFTSKKVEEIEII